MTSTPDIVMYSSGWCPYCMRARALLERKGLPFRELKIDEDPTARDTMLARTGGRRTVPQIFVGDFHVGGFDDLYALDQAGKLDELISNKDATS